MASAQVVETSVNNNSPSQDSSHPDDLFQSRYVTPGFKPFSYILTMVELSKMTLFRFGGKRCVTSQNDVSEGDDSPSKELYHEKIPLAFVHLTV